MAFPYSQIIFPPVRCQGGNGVIEIRVGIDNAHYDLGPSPESTNGRLIIESPSRMVSNIGPIKKLLNDEDGDMSIDSFEFSLNDSIEYSGTEYTGALLTAGAVSETTSQSLIKTIFSYGSRFYLWLTRYIDGSAPEIYFRGSFLPEEVTYEHDEIDNWGTSSEYQLVRAKVKCKASILRETEEHDTQDVINFIDSNYGDVGYENLIGLYLPFYAGVLLKEEGQIVGTSSDDFFTWAKRATSPINANGIVWDDDILASNWYNRVDLAAFQYFEDGGITLEGNFPVGTWAIRLSQIALAVAGACGFEFNESADFTALYEFVRSYWDGTNNCYAYSSPVDVVDELYACYNYIFGVSPADTLPFESPITFKRDEPVRKILVWLCAQLGSYLWHDVDQTNGKLQLRILSRDTNFGALPSDWLEGAESKEEPISMNKRGIKVKNTGSSETLLCPSSWDEEGLINFELLLKARRPGSHVSGEDIWLHSDMFVNGGWSGVEQYKAFSRATDDDILEGDGWVGGAYLYAYSADNFYPPNITAPPHGRTWMPSTFTGYHVISAVTEKPGVYTNRNNTLFAVGQAMYRRLISVKRQISREYVGITAEDGTIRHVVPGITTSFKYDGAVRNFKARELEIYVHENRTVIKWIEDVDFTALDDQSTRTKGGNETSSTSGSSGTSGTSGSSVAISGSAGVMPFIGGSKQLLPTTIIFSPTNTTGLYEASAQTDGPDNLFYFAQQSGAGKPITRYYITEFGSSSVAAAITIESGATGATGIDITVSDTDTSTRGIHFETTNNFLGRAVDLLNGNIYIVDARTAAGADSVYIDKTDGGHAINIVRTGSASKHCINIQQLGSDGKGIGVLINNASNGNIGVESIVGNATSAAIPFLGHTFGTQRAAIFQRTNSAPTDPVMEIRENNTAAAKFGLFVNNLGVGGGASIFTAGDAKIILGESTGSETAAIIETVRFKLSSTGTAAAGLGHKMQFTIQSSTGTERAAGNIQFLWNSATDSSYKGELKLQATDSSATRTAFNAYADGSAIRTAVNGATPVVRAAAITAVAAAGAGYVQAYANSQTNAINSIITAIKDFGITL